MSAVGGKLKKDFTSGVIPKQLLFFMVPFMLSNAMQVLYSTVDMIIVGKYVGTAGLSAVSQSSQIINFATMVCLGFANGGQVMIAQALGAGKKKEMSQIIGTLAILVGAIAVLVMAIFFFGQELIIWLVKIPEEAKDYSKDYLLICTLGMIFTAGYNMVSAVLRAMGDSKRPFLFICIASIINLVLDIVFTGFLGLEVAGAAWATIIGQAVSFIFACFYLYRKRDQFGLEFTKDTFTFNGHYAKMIAALGAPLAIQSGCIHISMLFVNSLVNGISVVASATFGVGIRIDDIVNKISIGIQYAALPMISQNIAAGKQKRAVSIVRWAWCFSGVFTVVAMLAYVLFSKQLFMIFSSDPAVHELSGTFVKAILFMFPALAVMRGTTAFIQGIGNAKLSLVLALLDGVILRIGLSWLFGVALDLGFYGLVLGYGLAPYGMAVPGLIYFLSGIWKKRRVLAEDI